MTAVLQHIDDARREIGVRLQGLTDDEALWEPVAGCWTLRCGAGGNVTSDWSPSPEPPPFTTIAWRLAHVGQSLRAHSRRLYGLGDFSFDTVALPMDAAGLVAFVGAGFDLWRAGAGVKSEAGAMTGELATEVIGLTDHAREHTVEVGVIRALYRASRPLDDEPFVDAVMRGDESRLRDAAPATVEELVAQRPDVIAKAAQLGRWNVIPYLVDAGFPVDSMTGGATAVHYAVAAAALPTLRLLVEHGADINRRDEQWGQTPLGWGEYFGGLLQRNEAADYLRSMGGDASS